MSKKLNRKSEHPAWMTCDKTIFVGIDIGKSFSKAKAIIQRQENLSKVCTFEHNLDGYQLLEKFIEGLLKNNQCDKVKIAMEPTAQYWVTAFEYLQGKGFETYLVRSGNVRQYKEMKDNSKLKTDEKDAAIIADLLFTGNYFKCREYSEEFQILKIHSKSIQKLEQELVRYKNRLEGFRVTVFPELREVFDDLGCATARKLMYKYPFPEDIIKAGKGKLAELLRKSSRGVKGEADAVRLLELAKKSIGKKFKPSVREAMISDLRKALDLIEVICKQSKELAKDIEKAVGKIPFAENIDAIPGIGKQVIARVVAATGDIREYDHSRQIIKKLGLNLYRLSSGKKDGRDKISHRGDGAARHALFMAALQQTREGGDFYEKYRSMVDRGMPKMKAIVAIMRLLVRIIFAVVRDNKPYVKPTDKKLNGNQTLGAKKDESVIGRGEQFA